MLGWKPKFKDPGVASVRYRCLNPLAELRTRGFPVELYSKKNLPRYSGVIFSKLYDKHSYQLARRLKKQGRKVVFDLCDNHLYNPYCLELFEEVRRQILSMLGLADLVVASTDELARVLSEEGRLSSPPVVVGDAVEEVGSTPPGGWLARVRSRLFSPVPPRDGKSNLLWFGMHGVPNAPCGMLDLLHKKELLAEINRIHSIRLVVVSNSRKKYQRYIRSFPFETLYLRWNRETFPGVLSRSDLNLIPISPNPFTLCKSNNRLASALCASVPTVADSIPSYRDLASFCVLDDWERGLRLYLDDPRVGQEHVARAREYIGTRYSIRQIGDRWTEALSRIL